GLEEPVRQAVESRLRGRGCRLELALPPASTLSGTLRGLTPEGRLQIVTQDGEISVAGGAEITRLHDNPLP
ncbi:MAG: hypothetical protein ACF8NJ_04230, partial [Phycisphaerales bacterium JB038]